MDMKPCLFDEHASRFQIQWWEVNSLFYIKLLFIFIVSKPGLSDEQMVCRNILQNGFIGQFLVIVCSTATLDEGNRIRPAIK